MLAHPALLVAVRESELCSGGQCKVSATPSYTMFITAKISRMVSLIS